MKNLFGVALVLFASTAFAKIDVAPSVTNLKVTEVSYQGTFLKRNQMFPVETVLIGIPVKVATESACVNFVGQETRRVGSNVVITAKGSTDPMQDACIEIYPMPIDTVFTLSVTHNTEALPADPHEAGMVKRVTINNRRYEVSINFLLEEVTIKPAGQVPSL